MKYWLMKTEPDVFSIDDLASRPDQSEPWDGVRNYQARNMMRDEMKPGDGIFFYHSNCDVPGIVGVARVLREGYPDHTSWNPESKYYDPKSSPDNPRWFMVDVGFERKFSETISLQCLRSLSELSEMPLVRKGNRLSVMPVGEYEWNFILGLAQ
ncbi:MAG: EVE domain-containing protein [Hahellaceae bacterium]|nr:EVE domain-containing protein [Hahellaceae bacterium]